jgi:quinol-cytochrome oxidoreductase complex cytochrome b subunit/mono/diheme cytochrome c family protein
LFKQLADWLDDRTGFRELMKEALEEKIPGGPRWRYVFGSALSVIFMVQAFTGILLMTSYSPSSSMAWASVFFISHEMWWGWFVRGVHHFAAQAMVVLLALHLLQVLWAGAYRRPREFNWWFGMALLFLTLGFSLTGYLLPWDQKGYWATKVATNIMGGAPVLGPYLQKILVGGQDYGNQTVTRFYGLHVGVLPGLLVLCLAAHIALFRRHGITPPKNAEKRPTAMFWPEQLFMDAVFSTLVVGVVIFLVVAEGGANLDAPADPSSSDYPARPEWYFLSLFQMLKLFPGDREMIGTIVIPTALVVLMMLLPFVDRILPRKLAHFVSCAFVFAIVGGACYLTVEAMRADAGDSSFQESRKKADAARQRAIFLAGRPDAGIPPDGSAYILRRDPLTQGRAVLERRCLGCHVFDGKGTGTQSASDLAHFGSRVWIRGLLEKPTSPTYFGKVAKFDGMAEWKRSSKLNSKELDQVADFVASFAAIPDDMTTDDWISSPGVSDHPGLAPFQKECGKCHVIDGMSEGGLRESPGLYGWGSPWWIARMIRRPRASDKYGFLDQTHQNQMPAFGSDEIIASDLEALVRYLKDDYVPTPAAAAATSD